MVPVSEFALFCLRISNKVYNPIFNIVVVIVADLQNIEFSSVISGITHCPFSKLILIDFVVYFSLPLLAIFKPFCGHITHRRRIVALFSKAFILMLRNLRHCTLVIFLHSSWFMLWYIGFGVGVHLVDVEDVDTVVIWVVQSRHASRPVQILLHPSVSWALRQVFVIIAVVSWIYGINQPCVFADLQGRRTTFEEHSRVLKKIFDQIVDLLLFKCLINLLNSNFLADIFFNPVLKLLLYCRHLL